MPKPAEKTKKKQKASGKLYALNMRTTFELRRQLEEAAAESGRSLTREVEHRLERSFTEPPVIMLAQISEGLQSQIVKSNVLLATIANKLGISTTELDANLEQIEDEREELGQALTAIKRLGPERFRELLKQLENTK